MFVKYFWMDPVTKRELERIIFVKKMHVVYVKPLVLKMSKRAKQKTRKIKLNKGDGNKLQVSPTSYKYGQKQS